ncbi:MAG TPA: hypothetical protein VLL08_17990 [Kineosporiaceae bacterium]|nr:hypothetical protein [Kineosporiaceae bacterium]
MEHPVADVLRVLAISRSSGALEVRGARGGTFFLYEGDITYAEALDLPPAKVFDADDPQLPSTLQSAIVEAGLALLAEENVDGERPLFRPGRRHWSGRLCRLRVDAFLSEITQRLARFTELGVEPDDQVQLCRLAPGRMAVLSRRQWALAAELGGAQTARALARRSGSPLSVTIETVASMVVAGVVQRPPTARQVSVQPARVATPVRKAVVRAPVGRESELPEARLPHRVRGATSRTAQGPEYRPRLPPHEDEAAQGRALALRLLEGLRKL